MDLTDNLPSVQYIVSIYPGVRRHCPGGSPIYEFIDAHLHFLNSSPKFIQGAAFSISADNKLEGSKIAAYINKHAIKVPVFTSIRDNKSGSYGAWADVLKIHSGEYDYSFLIEDDYVPVNLDIVNFFIESMGDTVKFVASLCKTSHGKYHAAISNGLINNKLVHKTLEERGDVFNLIEDTSYSHGLLYNQLNFLDNIKGELMDVSNKIRVEFLDAGRRINIYGNPNSPLVIKSLIR